MVEHTITNNEQTTRIKIKKHDGDDEGFCAVQRTSVTLDECWRW